MTYKEAIFNLKEIREYNILDDEMYVRYYQALNMAIDALEDRAKLEAIDKEV